MPTKTVQSIFQCNHIERNTEVTGDTVREGLYSYLQEQNPYKFNEEMIHYKSTEDPIVFADAIGKGLEIIPAITYEGSEIESIRRLYHHSETERKMEINKSRLQKIIMKFKISKGGEEIQKKLSMYFPVLLENQFYLLDGNLYTPVYQLLDSGTYRTKKNLILKTLIMPISINDVNTTFKDTEGEEYISKSLYMNLFKKKVNMFVYYFASFGLLETLEYFDMDSDIFLVDLQEDEFVDDSENFIHFKVNNSLGITVTKSFLKKNENNSILMNTFLSNFTNRTKLDKALEQDFWVRQLGSKFTTNNSVHYEKGENILVSFKRTLDEVTKMTLRIPDEDKEDVYTIVRYMARNFKKLSRIDNMDLCNKRLRLQEQQFYPLIRKFSRGIYRLLNKKNLTIKEIESIFNIKSGFLVSYLINKSKDLRYINNVNSYDLFSVALKITQGGKLKILDASLYNQNSLNCWKVA